MGSRVILAVSPIFIVTPASTSPFPSKLSSKRNVLPSSPVSKKRLGIGVSRDGEPSRQPHMDFVTHFRKFPTSALLDHLLDEGAVSEQVARVAPIEKFHFELQGRISRDFGRAATSAISVITAAGQYSLFATLHRSNTDIPTSNNMALTKLKNERVATVAATVKLGSIQESAHVMNLDLIARLGGFIGAPLNEDQLRNTSIGGERDLDVSGFVGNRGSLLLDNGVLRRNRLNRNKSAFFSHFPCV
mmetsp:Transcript_2113/g.3172  ORF Transcript_2113/g.3172 Transcript_2113/m.3172 type:complete len:245 (-) Transcript_2113:93-827(-)